MNIGKDFLDMQYNSMKVNKQLPRVEQELHQLSKEWEEETGHTFLVEGVNFEVCFCTDIRSLY